MLQFLPDYLLQDFESEIWTSKIGGNGPFKSMHNLHPLTVDGNYEKHPIKTSSVASRVDRSGTTSIGDALKAIATAKSGESLSSREDDTKYVYFSREPVCCFY